MKSTRPFAVMTLLLLLAPAGRSLHAQVLPIHAQLTIQSQDRSTLVNGVYTDKVKTSKATSKDLLDLLAAACRTNFPTGAQLVLENYDHFLVQAADGTVLATNVSNFLTYADTYNDGAYLFHGKENINTNNLARSQTFLYSSTIHFNDFLTNGTVFSLSGTAQERYSQTPADQYNHRIYKYSYTLTGMGYGNNGNGFFLISGKVTTGTLQLLQ